MSKLLTQTTAKPFISSELTAHYKQMQQRFNDTPYLSIKKRIQLLKLLKHQLIQYETELVAASSKDFGYRTSFDTLMGDIIPSIKAISYTIKHLPKWSKHTSRRAELSLFPANVSLSYQPKGVVGIISPWNYPIQLALMPVITALGAGNRVLLKVSEYTVHTNQVLKQLFTDELAEHCIVIEGEKDISQQFSHLPFAHLFFTGSAHVGRQVMAAASQNLTPVTLELGGKSPVLVMHDADVDKAAKAILFGKMTNAGQVCVSPDYVLVPRQLQHQLLYSVCSLYKKYFSNGVEGKNLSSIINHDHYQQLNDLLDDASIRKAQIIKPLNENMLDPQKHRMGLHILTHVNDDMAVMQKEIFGPILPIIEYDSLNEAVNYINNHAAPLTLYVMGKDKEQLQFVEMQTQSGSFVVNDALLQVAADDIPFGGIGESGMGNYHAKEGFITFSHARSRFYTGRFNPRLNLLLSQNKLLLKLIKWMHLRP